MPRDPYRGGKPTPPLRPAAADQDEVETKVPCPLCEQGMVSVEVHIAFVDWCRERQSEA